MREDRQWAVAPHSPEAHRIDPVFLQRDAKPLYAIGIVVVMLATCGAAYVFGYLTGRRRGDDSERKSSEAIAVNALRGATESMQKANARIADYDALAAELERYKDFIGELPAKW